LSIKMKLRLLVGSAAALLVVVACSGAENTGDLFAPSDSSNLGANPSTPEQNSSSSSGSTSSSGSSGTVGDDGDDDDDDDNGSSGSSGTSGSSSSGGPKDAGPDAPPPANGGTIYCGATGGTASCTAGSEICCGSWKSGKFAYSCEQNGFLACAGGTTIACDDSSDCASGQVCCGTLSNNRYTSVECKATCNNSIGGRAVRFCNPKAAVDECAALGKSCKASQTLPGYHVCAD